MTRNTVRVRDLASEVVDGVLRRPGRSVLTALGTVLGIAAFVAVLGLTATAGGQINARFTALAATEVSLTWAHSDQDLDLPAFDDAARARVAELPGVEHVGVSWPANIVGAKVSATPDSMRQGADSGEDLAVTAATPDFFAAIHARMSGGIQFDAFHDGRGERVAVLGAASAARLGVTRLDALPAIFVGDEAFTVIGVVGSADRRPDVLLSVLIPARTATAVWGPTPASGERTTMLVETRLGAAPQVGRQARIAVRPDATDRVEVIAPPDPRELRDGVATDLDALFVGLAAISLVIGALGIANTSLVAVLERVGEIGLRRALGARRRDISVQFLLESVSLGLLGGLAGTTTGIVVVVGVALERGWTPILDPLVVYPAPVVGAIIGLLSGCYPAWRASRIEPTDALRR
ncbi:ABC transporter related [Alloactinosynnema sp. L-07]|uniref:ABC transporter permease n=1 Tax=Alloactinosynnema sp. L-07 TaxID=1653480 RepID=UPI00065EFC75|nr:ABC transporter permease [Alloactinosynnema sp. L-07]CRK60642.1 ABC transporter related [Alloactinosynnema sp. L-07]